MYTPPTDSLYKFCALTGVVVLLLSVYVPFAFNNDLDSKVRSLTQQIGENEAQIEYWEELTQHFGSIVSNTIARQRGEYTSQTRTRWNWLTQTRK